MNDGEVEGGGGARISEEDSHAGKKKRGTRGIALVAWHAGVLREDIGGPVRAPAAARRGMMFHHETEGRRSRRRRGKRKNHEKEEEEEVALARRGVTVAYVNHIEARTI